MWVCHHALTFLLEILSSGDSYARNFRDNGLEMDSEAQNHADEGFFYSLHNHNLNFVEYKYL